MEDKGACFENSRRRCALWGEVDLPIELRGIGLSSCVDARPVAQRTMAAGTKRKCQAGILVVLICAASDIV